MKSGELVLGVLAGAAVGALAGILFAPQKGSRTRADIANKSEDYAEALKTQFDDLLESITDKYDSIKHDAESMLAKGKSKFADARKDHVAI